MASAHRFGYLLVHFVEDPHGHGEQIYFSLSDGEDPLTWDRLNGGRPVLTSHIGTTGVRDPHIIRAEDGWFHIVATDLRVWRTEGQDWEEFRRHGSRSILIWDSPDLLSWQGPRSVEVAPPSAGMAWAPETVLDPATGEYVLHFASALYADDDPGHEGPALAQLLTTRTRDFHTFTPAEPYLSLPGGVIDMTVAFDDDGRVHRFAKQDDDAPGSWQVFQQVGDGIDGDFRTLATNLGQQFGPRVEAPLIFRANDGDRWYLWVDQYGRLPQGYHALTSRTLDGKWERVPGFSLPPHTKHGAVLPLIEDEWQRLRTRDADGGWPDR